MSRRLLELPSFLVHPTRSFRSYVGGAYEIDDISKGFEAGSTLDWLQMLGGGTITIVTSPVKWGLYSCRINCTTLASYAYLEKTGFTLTMSGRIRLLCWVYPSTYYGTTYNDGQDILPITTPSNAYGPGFYIRQTGLYGILMNSSVTLQSPGLSTGAWHKLLADLNVSTKTCDFYVDDAYANSLTVASLESINRFWVGDPSGTTRRGDFYWDGILLGRAPA